MPSRECAQLRTINTLVRAIPINALRAASAILNDISDFNTSSSPPLRFGIVLLPNFTLAAFSGFVDLLTSATGVGICTGVFALMRANVMAGYRFCVSWFHYWDFVERIPAVDERNLVEDRLFVIDRRGDPAAPC